MHHHAWSQSLSFGSIYTNILLFPSCIIGNCPECLLCKLTSSHGPRGDLEPSKGTDKRQGRAGSG